MRVSAMAATIVMVMASVPVMVRMLTSHPQSLAMSSHLGGKAA
jgi:hypothetical protein